MANKVMVELKLEKAGKEEKTELLNKIKVKIKKLLALNRKGRVLSAKGIAICKKIITKNLRKAKQLELKLKTKSDERLRVRLECIKKQIEAARAMIKTFSEIDNSFNAEIGWLLNEAGNLKKPEFVKKAAKEEAACIEKQKAMIDELKKQLNKLRIRPTKPKLQEQKPS